HRGRSRGRRFTGRRAGVESIPEPAADNHDSRGSPGQGLLDQRPGAACLPSRAEPVLTRRNSMSRRLLIILFAVGLIAVPLRAQIVVIDPANLTQTILIQERTYQQLDQLRREFEVIQRMAQKLGSLDRYRIPPIFVTSHDPSLWDYGRPWIQALNTGDARGPAYYETALPLLRPRQDDLSRLPAAARRMFQSQYATMEITDSVALTGAHQVALVRNYFGKLQDATQELENDLVSTQT